MSPLSLPRFFILCSTAHVFEISYLSLLVTLWTPSS